MDVEKSLIWGSLRKCRRGEHCSCGVSVCCYCENRDLTNEEQLRLVAPYRATEDEIKAFLEEPKS